MQVDVVRWHPSIRRTAPGAPRLILERGRAWSDQASSGASAYSTLFDLHHDDGRATSDETGAGVHEGGRSPVTKLGSVKVLRRGNRPLDFPQTLDGLPEDCCSLGQTIDYYEAIQGLGEAARQEVLRAMRDVTADEAIARAFETEPGFRESLLRFSEAARIYACRPLALHRQSPTPERLHLRFETHLVGFDAPHVLDLDFDPEPRRLGRLAAIIGKNGAGKTQLLARLAAALWGLLRRDRESLLIEGRPVGRVIAVSYSALDMFERPPHRMPGLEFRPVFDNYWYAGLRDPRGELRSDLLFKHLEDDLKQIRRLGRLDMWRRMLAETRLDEGMSDVPGREGGDAPAAWSGDGQDTLNAAERLGAGQKTVLGALTHVLAALRNGAFVLFDEPELNLHPALLSAVLRVLHEWLVQFDGHGVLATHSPMVLQEIPGKSVRIVERHEGIPLLRPYEAESFGQSLPEIVGEAFGINERDKNYVSVLRGMIADGLSQDDIEALLRRPLSLNARMALRALAPRGRDDA